MKLFFNKRFIKSIAIGLIALLCFTQPANDYVYSGGTVKAAGTGTNSDTDGSDQDATADSETTTSELPEDLNYVSEVRLFQATSYEKAKKAATDSGYTVAGSDMNSGTEKGDWGDFWSDRGSGDSVVLGYKTTKDRADAITSMKMAEMDTGYQTFDYEEIEKSMNTGMNILAEDIIAALAEVKQNISRGDSYAGKVKEALNLYYIPYMDNKGLGDMLFDESMDAGKIAQMLKRTNLSVISSILSNITMGVTGTPIAGQSGNFAERIAANSEKLSGMKKSDYVSLDALYRDEVRDIRDALQSYANEIEPSIKAYQDAGGSMSDSFVEEHTEDALSMQAYNRLNEYKMADGTGVGTYLYRIGSTSLKSKEDLREAYPIVMAMSPGQHLMFAYTGVIEAATYMSESSEALSFAEEVMGEIQKKIKDSGLEGTQDGRLPIYPPNQDALYRAQIAMTSEATRAASARDEYQKLTQSDKDMELWDEVMTWGNRVLIFAMAAAVLGKIVTWAIKKIGQRWLFETLGWRILTRLGMPVRVLGNNMVTFIAFIVIMAIWYGIEKLKAENRYYNPDLSEVPRFMYSVEKITNKDGQKENAYILYKPSYNGYFETQYEGEGLNTERVKVLVCEDYEDILYGDSASEIARKNEHNKKLFSDFNARQGKKWNALYTTKDPNAGSPICGEDINDIFMIQKGDYSESVSGYQAFSSFGNENAVNLNSNQYEDKDGGIYLYYRTEETLKDPVAARFKQSGKYVSDLILVSEKDEKDAKAAIKLKAGKYHFLDQNLTPDEGCYTYLGFATTENINDAIRDIRVDCISTGNSLGGGYRRNNIGYAEVGSSQSGSFTLYQTAVNQGETDISSKVASESSEAVSGGGASAESVPDSTFMSYSGAPILADFEVVDSLGKAPVGYEPIIPGSGGAAFNFNIDRGKRRYVYYQPAVSFVSPGTKVEEKKGVTYVESDEEYISGIHAFFLPTLGPSNSAKNKLKDKIRNMGYTPFDPNLNEKYKLTGKYQQNTCYIGYATTRNPFRAIGDIRYYKGTTFSESIQSSVPSAEGTYLAMDVYNMGGDKSKLIYTKDYSGFNDELADPKRFYTDTTDDRDVDSDTRAQYDARSLQKEPVEAWQKLKVKRYYPFAERGMYVLAADDAHPALKPSDILVSKDASAPAGMRPISHIIYPYMTENFDISTWMDGVHFYIRREKERRKAYVSGIYVATYTPPSKMNDEQEYFTYKAADDMAMISAYAGCNGEVLPTNIAVEPQYAWYQYLDADSEPVKQSRYKYYYKDLGLKNQAKHYAYVGVSYTDERDEAITGILRYKFKGKTAPSTIKVGGVKYYKAGNEVGDVCYYTTTSSNSSPGLPITEVSFDENLVLGGSGTIFTTDKVDPSDLQQKLDAIDEDDDLEPYEKILKKTELKKNAVNLSLKFHNKISGHVKVDTTDSSITQFFIGRGKNHDEAIRNVVAQGAALVYSYDTNYGLGTSIGRPETADGSHKGLPFGTDSMDLKSGGKPAEESVCIGYSLGVTEGEDADDVGIRDILITEGEPYQEDGFEKDGCEYYPVSDVSLNSGTDGDEIYMYCTWDESEKTSSPIVSLVMARADAIPSGAGVTRYEYIMTDKGEIGNLNRGATTVFQNKFVETRLFLFAHRYDNTVKREALFDITDWGRKTIRMDVKIKS